MHISNTLASHYIVCMADRNITCNMARKSKYSIAIVFYKNLKKRNALFF